MIKVTIGESKTQEVKEFPKLMKGSLGSIVLFLEPTKGIYIRNDNDKDKAPFFYNDWTMDAFTDYNEPITIQNQ